MESQTKYFPIVSMFYSRRSNTKINRLYERALIIVYDDDVSFFNQLRAMDKFVFTIKILRTLNLDIQDSA